MPSRRAADGLPDDAPARYARMVAMRLCRRQREAGLVAVDERGDIVEKVPDLQVPASATLTCGSQRARGGRAQT